MAYIPLRHYDPKTSAIAGCAMAGVLLVCLGTAAGCFIYRNSQTNKALDELNTKIERDLDIDSFTTESVIFDKTNENFILRIAGSSKRADYVAADYKVSEKDFYNLKTEKTDVVSIKSHDYSFIENIVDILYRSEFLGKEAEELALINNGELVLNLSKPYVDKETDSMNYNLTIAKLHNNDLKLGTFIVSAPLDDQLKENPKAIYAMPSEKVEIEKVEVKTYRDVSHVEMHDDHTLIF